MDLKHIHQYLDLDLEDFKICDIGDLELSVGNTDKVLDEIYESTKEIVNDNKIPFMIGGEHLVTLPAFKQFMINMKMYMYFILMLIQI